jgi:hypothetical protein
VSARTDAMNAQAGGRSTPTDRASGQNDGGRGTAPGTGRTGRRRTIALVVAVVVLLAAVALAAGPPRPDEAYDPRNVGPAGLAGLVDLLEAMDVDVVVSGDPPSDMSTYLFIASGRLPEDARAQVRAWVEEGGTVVVAGDSLLHDLDHQPGPVADVFGVTSRAPDCDAPALEQVDVIEHAGWDAFVVPEDAHHACFPLGADGAFVVEVARGEGTVIAIGSADPFVNANLDRADNAVLAAALLAPAPGDHVVVAPPPQVGEGEIAVLDLVPTGFWRLLLLATLGVVVAILWTARRLGQPVPERLPPVLPSAELARSVAGLLQRSGDRRTTAGRLRADARRRVERAWGLPGGTDPHELVAFTVERAGLDRSAAEAALLPGEVHDDDQLVDVATACSQLHQALRRPAVEAAAPKHRDDDATRGPGGDGQAGERDRGRHGDGTTGEPGTDRPAQPVRDDTEGPSS